MRNLSDTGHQYTTLNDDDRRGYVTSYHHKPPPVSRTKAKHVDISNLKSIDRKNVLSDGHDVESKFSIGFEVEKNRLHRNSVQEYPLFCGFERDGSCGYEAVTHILPLVGASSWRTKVYDMMHQAKKIIDDQYSPSNAKCGGHITLAVKGMNGEELAHKLRKNSGLILALFRKRIANSYCNKNLDMRTYETYAELGHDGLIGGWHSKYQFALVKDFGVEYRIPSRFTSVKQMMRRYELFYELVDFSVNNPNGTFNSLLKRVRPILMNMYGYDTEKVKDLERLAKHFRNMMLTRKINEHIVGYFIHPRHGQLYTPNYGWALNRKALQLHQELRHMDAYDRMEKMRQLFP